MQAHLNHTLRATRRFGSRGWFTTLAAASIAWSAQAQVAVQLGSPGSGTPYHADSGVCSISEDGRYVAFASDAADLVPNDTNGVTDVFRLDRTTGQIELISVTSAGGLANKASGGLTNGGRSVAISADGRFVAFISRAQLAPGFDFNGTGDAYLRDTVNHTTQLVSDGATFGGGAGNCTEVSIDGTGAKVAFTTTTALVATDTNLVADVYTAVFNGTKWFPTLQSYYPSGVQILTGSSGPSLSKSSRYLSFVALPTPGATNTSVFTRSLFGTPATALTCRAGDICNYPDLSNNGRYLCYHDSATLTVVWHDRDSDGNGIYDEPLGSLDMTAGQGNSQAYASISPEGKRVVYNSDWSFPGDTTAGPDTFVWDSSSNTSLLMSLTDSNAQGTGLSFSQPDICMNGQFVAFATTSALVPADMNGLQDVYVALAPASTSTYCVADSSPGALPCPCGNQGTTGRGCENSAGTGGGLLTSSGTPSITADTLGLTASSLTGSLALLYQTPLTDTPIFLQSDGLACFGQPLHRLVTVTIVGQTATFPPAGGPSITGLSAGVGVALQPGQSWGYQVLYRYSTGLCYGPPGTNLTNGVVVRWGT